MVNQTFTLARSRAQTGWLWGGYALMLALAPWLFSSGWSHSLLSQMGIAIIACLSFNILLGQGGMLSFGHAVYSGLGAFFAMHTLNWLAAGGALPVSLLPLVGGVGAAAVALVLGWVSTKQSATAFAMITLALGELVWAASLMFPSFFGGEGGVSGNRVVGASPFGLTYGPQIQLYYLIAAYTLLCTALMFAFTRTPLGRLLNAVRDNPERVEFVGYSSHLLRYMAFVVSAFFAGIAGGLAALNFEIVTAEGFSAQRSGAYLLFTFLGGTGYFFGPIIGAVLMVLAFVGWSEFTPAWLLYLGLVFVFMVVCTPGGVASLVAAHVRVFRAGQFKTLWAPYTVLLAAALPVLLGGGAAVEMLYHLKLSATLGNERVFLGLHLNVGRVAHWVAALLTLALGAGLMAWAVPPFQRRWRAVQLAMEKQKTERGSV